MMIKGLSGVGEHQGVDADFRPQYNDREEFHKRFVRRVHLGRVFPQKRKTS